MNLTQHDIISLYLRRCDIANLPDSRLCLCIPDVFLLLELGLLVFCNMYVKSLLCMSGIHHLPNKCLCMQTICMHGLGDVPQNACQMVIGFDVLLDVHVVQDGACVVYFSFLVPPNCHAVVIEER